MTELTPFDTGEVLEPVLHSNGFTGCPEDWGRVDFDDDEGTTRASVLTERRDDGRYVLYVVDQLTDEEHEIILGEGN